MFSYYDLDHNFPAMSFLLSVSLKPFFNNKLKLYEVFHAHCCCFLCFISL